MDFDWKALLGTLAPTIATVLGGPLAGAGVKALSMALGLAPTATEKELAAALQGMTPDQMVAVQKADQEFKLRMEELGVKLEDIAQKDRQSARNREVSLQDSWTPRVLGTVILGGFMGTVWMVVAGDSVNLKDPAIAGTVGMVIGYVSAKADQVVAYYFGSSASSRGKDAALQQAATK